MKPNNTKHLLCMDFESWIVSREINKENLSNSRLKSLDNHHTLNSLKLVLNLLKKYQQKITFFLVFRLEEIYPGLIEKILSEGHEVGWHGYSHNYLLNEDALAEELNKSKRLLDKYKIKGFQAPNLAFFEKGYRLLKDYGFTYSSSIYGDPEKIFKIDQIYEIPVSTSNKNYNAKRKSLNFDNQMRLNNIFKTGIPFGSSYFWSLFGKNYYHHKLRGNKTNNLFIHSWQILKPKSKSKQYMPKEQTGIFNDPIYLPYKISVPHIFESLLSRHTFVRVGDYLNEKRSI